MYPKWRSLSYFLFLIAIVAPVESSLAANDFQRTIEKYQTPAITLINQNGEKFSLTQLTNQDKPVLLQFIYATCTTICPILSAGYSSLQRKLGSRSNTMQLISISIDPEYDNPKVMNDYLERYRAKPGWDYLTGTREDIDVIMHAYDAYVSNKMSHYPLTLIKVPGKEQWVRLYGMVGTQELIKEIEALYGPVMARGQEQ